jgi:hypothetical protein
VKLPGFRQAVLFATAFALPLTLAACSDSVEFHPHAYYGGISGSGSSDAGPDAHGWMTALPPPGAPDGAPAQVSPALLPPDGGNCDAAASSPLMGAPCPYDAGTGYQPPPDNPDPGRDPTPGGW